MIVERTAKSQVISASTQITSRDTQMTNFSVRPGLTDVVVKFKSGGQTFWEVEADSAAGSHAEHFDPPLRFKNGLYVELDQANANTTVCVAIL